MRFAETPLAHTNNCRCDAWKCDIMPQIKVNPSKATYFFSLLLSLNSLPPASTEAHKPSGHWLFKQHVPIKSYLLTRPSSLSSSEIRPLTDGVGAELLPQLWRSFLVSNSDLWSISQPLLLFCTQVLLQPLRGTIYFPFVKHTHVIKLTDPTETLSPQDLFMFKSKTTEQTSLLLLQLK